MSYSDVHPNVFQACLEVQTGVSIRSAAEKYGISKSTLWNRTRSIIAKKADRPKKTNVFMFAVIDFFAHVYRLLQVSGRLIFL